MQSTGCRRIQAHFTLIFGGSGSGKSSLARAGVMPMLVRPGVVEGIGLWRSGNVTTK